MNTNTTEQPQEKLFTEGGSFFRHMINDIAAAKKNIDLETYIFSNDKVGQPIADALVKAAKRGVTVRVLVDGAGSPLWGGSIARKMDRAGIQTRIFHPLPWIFWQWRRAKIRLPLLLKIVYLFLKMNSRNHRKTCTIDNKVAFLGSMNINRCHLGKDEGGDAWHDMAIRLQYVNLEPLTSAFEAAWDHHDIQERLKDTFRHVKANPIFRLNHTWQRRRILYRNFLKRVGKCTDRIWITNAYFVPNNFLLKKIKEAARNNIDVRILLPQKSDVFIMSWASSTFYYSLLKAGARIFEYTPSMLHAKTLILDQWITVGSSNLNHRSLLHDLEADVNIRLQESKKMVEQQFLTDIALSREIHLDNWHKRPLYQRTIGRLALYLKFWI